MTYSSVNYALQKAAYEAGDRWTWKEETFLERWFSPERDNEALMAARRAVVKLGWAPPGVWWGPAPGRATTCVVMPG